MPRLFVPYGCALHSLSCALPLTLNPAEEPLDEVAFLVGVLVVTDRLRSRCRRGDDPQHFDQRLKCTAPWIHTPLTAKVCFGFFTLKRPYPFIRAFRNIKRARVLISNLAPLSVDDNMTLIV